MWRMALVAMAVVAAYVLVPATAARPSSQHDAQTYGKPWTMPALIDAFKSEGAELNFVIEGVVDYRNYPNRLNAMVEQPVLVGRADLPGYAVIVFVYSSAAARRLIWSDRGGPPRGSAFLDQSAWVLDNAVIELSPNYQADNEGIWRTLHAAVLKLQGE